jgi:hypothetical protein
MRRLIFRAAGRTEEFFDKLQAHYRECKRKDVDAEAQIRILLADGSVFDTGTAHVKNVSATGALLVDIELSKRSYPSSGFSLELVLTTGGYKGITFRATPVRFVPEQSGIGVKFDEIYVSAGDEKTPRDAEDAATS